MYNNDIYYYIKNLQGDIIGLLNNNYEQIVNCEYDSCGRVLSVKDNEGKIIIDSNNIGIINPFRYRGYYYDEETGFYYVPSRYYDSGVGRWINADIPETLTADFENFAQYNLFAYCFNNPVNMSDETGTWPSWAKKVVAAVVVVAAVTGAITGAAGSAVKVSQAAKAWDSGTFKSGYKSMKYHYNKHVVSEGLSKGNNVLKYTQDAVSFANRNSSVLKLCLQLQLWVCILEFNLFDWRGRNVYIGWQDFNILV